MNNLELGMADIACGGVFDAGWEWTYRKLLGKALVYMNQSLP